MILFAGFSTEQMVQLSLLVIEVSFVLIVIAIIAYFLINRKTAEERHASGILKKLELMKSGEYVPEPQKKPSLEIKPEEFSLKQMLVKKFQPKIESQLQSKVVVKDFNAKGDNFLALVEISGVKLLLTLDSNGKIIDYKN